MVRAPGDSLDQPMLEAHLKQFVDRGQINKWAIPRQVHFVTDIPKTSIGKINKKLIREMHMV